jgi:hypothetical protein
LLRRWSRCGDGGGGAVVVAAGAGRNGGGLGRCEYRLATTSTFVVVVVVVVVAGVASIGESSLGLRTREAVVWWGTAVLGMAGGIVRVGSPMRWSRKTT